MTRTFRAETVSVNLIHKCLCSRPKVDDALLMRFSYSFIPDYRVSIISTIFYGNHISAAMPSVVVVPRRQRRLRRRFCYIPLFLDLTQGTHSSYVHGASFIYKSTLSDNDYACNAERKTTEERSCEYCAASKRSGIPMSLPYTNRSLS